MRFTLLDIVTAASFVLFVAFFIRIVARTL
jgi:hypothetical protein